jgi:hypothetical protein
MRNAIAIGLVGLLAATAFGQTRSTLAMLNDRIPEVSFQDAPFDQVMDWVADYSNANVVVRWQALELLGVERDKPITVRVRNLRLSQVLWMVMNEAGGADVKLAYRASGNLLVMSTADDLGEEMMVRVYDVSDLLIRVPRFRGAPRIDLTQQSSGGAGGGNVFGGSSGGGGQNDDDENNQGGGGQGNENDELAQQMIDLIQQTIEPYSWVQNGGLGTIQAFGRQLVVRNNILVHQSLGGPVEDAD